MSRSTKSMSRRAQKAADRKRAARRRNALRLSHEGLESRDLLSAVSFQQGAALSGGGIYSGQQDTVLYSRDADVNFGTEGSISPDQQDSNGVRQGMVKFEDIIGDDPGQIPLGSTINSATLTFNVVNDSNSAMQMSAYRMLTDWEESSATWNTFGSIGGVQASEGEASDLPPDAILYDPDTTGSTPTAGIFDVTQSLQYWVSGADNFGWMIESAATNGWDFRTKESAQSQRPMLTVDFTAPSGAGGVKFLDTEVTAAEGNSGTSVVNLDVARSGGTSGPLTVNYTVTAGTAGAGDFVATSGQVTFADGEAFTTIPVTINGDTVLEGNETIAVTLADNTFPTQNVATVTIGDDDALINEVLANVSNSASDETDREFIELIGTPGASLDGYNFVVFEGQEEEAGGTPSVGAPAGATGFGLGVADLVVDLTGQTFGSNGLLVIAPTNWAYQGDIASGTNVFNTAALDGAGGVLEDNSQTYALIRTPTNLVEGTDYDQIGFYDSASTQAVGDNGVGVLDNLPAGAQVVDSVGVVEGGGSDRDRTLAPEELGNPGIHVHQPTRINSGSGNVTSDAVSRRLGETLPNSLGVWFNGDIADGDNSGPIEYENDTFFISVVAPDGSVLTPGAPNVLRTVFFSVDDQQTEVAEADGSVTVTIERTGDLNEVVTVDYRTVGGTATEGVDYTAVTDQVTFGVGEASKDVTITLANDGVAEGFERFDIEITGVTGDYLITDGLSTRADAVNGRATITIEDANVQVATFQNGVDGYFGTEDAYLDGDLQFNRFGQSSIVRVDQVKGEGEDPITQVRPQQGLIKFDDLFGTALNQVPAGSTIFDAFLTVNVTNPSSGADVNFFPMLQDWEEVNASWFDPQGSAGGSILNGVTPDNVEASIAPDNDDFDAGRAGLVEIPLNVDTIQAWANGSAENNGWSIISDAAALWSFNSSEAFLPGTFRPELTILYTDPVVEDAGTFSLSVADTSVNEFAGFAELTINRIGGSSGAATVDWAVTPGTGDLTDIAGPASGQVSFADGELFKTFQVAINDDNAVEANETLNVSISGTGLTFGRDSEALTIRDNDFNPNGSDLLLNEIWINSPGNDPPHEFVELKGTAGVGMGSLYYVAVEGLIGDRTGVAEKVVDIGSFSNGSNGFSILTPDAADFAFNVPADTTQIDLLGSIAEENVASQNDSTTYLLLYSPFTELTSTSFDYDWDDDGALELPAGVQIVDSLGVLVLGVNDQIYGPSTNRAQFAVSDPDVDAVSRDRNSTSRNAGSEWFGGDLEPFGDDYLLYEVAEAFDLPAPGTALTPGEANTGTTVESPLVSLTGAVGNPDGTVTLSFNGPVSQLNLGDGSVTGPGGSAITVTDQSGSPVPGVDVLPTITGLGTNTLTVTFTGANVVGGELPTGDYQLNLVGNAITGNGRAIDAAGTGSATGSDNVIDVAVGDNADYNNNGIIDAADYSVWRDGAAGFGGLAGDGNGDGAVDQADYDLWVNSFGDVALNGIAPALASAAVVTPTIEEPPVETEPAVEAEGVTSQEVAFAPLAAKESALASLAVADEPVTASDDSDDLLLLAAQLAFAAESDDAAAGVIEDAEGDDEEEAVALGAAVAASAI